MLRMKGEGDIVIAEACPDLPEGEVIIQSITGDDGRLPLVAANNCVGIAAIETIKLLGNVDCGVSLTLQKVALPTAVCTFALLLWALGQERGLQPQNHLQQQHKAMHMLHACNRQQTTAAV